MPRAEEPRLSQFGPAFAWLLAKDVTSTRLAALFKTTPENVRVIAFRAQQGVTVNNAQESLNLIPSPEEAAAVGVRQTPDEVIPTPVRTRKLDQLRNEIELTVAQFSAAYGFLDGYRSLRRLAPMIGFAGDSRRIALSALLHHHSAWFLLHSGRCESATREAYKARILWRRAYQESRARSYAERFIQSALIGSQALLLTRRPEQAWELLEVASDAAQSIEAPEGSDYARQRGVVLFQLRQDDRAAVQFERAARAMEKMNEARIPAQLLMTGARHISLLGELKWARAQEILAIAGHSFGDGSLEASMALHWAAACALSTDSSSIAQDALDLLESSTPPAAQFGHQVTIRRLLAVTPGLGLDSRLRRMWVRRALYENAFRNR